MRRLGLHDVGHEGVITRRDALSLRSPIVNPQEVAQSPLQPTIYNAYISKKCHPQPTCKKGE
ncbi:hypothetical protein [Lysinibacillus xylanilyticus]|uniref:hypothetical protein n=1 Tax=Lysinibacillus xylanilyticus TaxID=582475 RepID=UPI003D082053